MAEKRHRIVLTRTNVTRVAAVACICALFSLPTVAHAQSTNDQLAATTRAIDRTAQRWFNAQNKAAEIDDRIVGLEHDIASAQARVAVARRVANERASLMYESASSGYPDVLGTTAIDSARRAELIDRANAKDEATIDELVSSLQDLKARHKVLVKARSQLTDALDQVASQRDELDAQLSSLRVEAQREAEVSAATSASNRVNAPPQYARIQAAASAPPTLSTPPPRASRPVVVEITPAPARSSGSGSGSAPPGGGSGSGGGWGSHHNDPFLVCTRARESNGDYAAVSPSGYYGAYQFLPSTWDVTAVHAHRMNLVGVLPSRASVAAQDDMAWALYQWQGKGPWGGRC